MASLPSDLADLDDAFGLPRVLRPSLIDRLCNRLDSNGLLLLSLELGMRGSSVLNDVAARLETAGRPVRSFHINSDSPEPSIRYVRRAARVFLSDCAEGSSPALLLDASNLIDDAALIRLASLVELAREQSACVLAAIHPDAEHVVEVLPACRVLHSCDFALEPEEYQLWGISGDGWDVGSIKGATHGIPLLMDALASLSPCHGIPLHSSVWSKALRMLMGDALRSSLIDEELLLRATMLALGEGGIADLRSLGVRSTRELMVDVGRSAPIFGVDSSGCRFEVVSFDVELLGEILPSAGCGSPTLWSGVCRLLAERGDFVRAGVIARSVGGSGALRDLVLAYPVELVDAGLVGLVDEAVRPHKGMGPAFDLARQTLSLVGAGDWGKVVRTASPARHGRVRKGVDDVDVCQAVDASHPVESARRTLTRLQVKLLRACRDASSGAAGEILASGSREEGLIEAARSSSSRVTRAIAAHLQVLALWLSGSALEAFRVLLLAHDLREQADGSPSVFSALLQLDFEALRCLVGDPDSDAERVALSRAMAMLDRGGLPAIVDSSFARCDMALAMTGGTPELDGMGRVMARRGDAGEVAELALMHLVTSLTDASKGSFHQANVHAWEAFRRAGEAGMDNVASLATMAERIALDGLGEGHRAAGLVHDGLEGIAADVQALVRLHASLGRAGAEATDSVAAEMRRVSPRVELAALAGLVVRADRVRGALLARALPGAWRARLDVGSAPPPRDRHAAGASGARPTRALPAPGKVGAGGGDGRAYGTGRVQEAPTVPRLEVCVMGGLSLALGERRITEQGWRRSSSKSLMALLALTPGHLVTRFEAIEFLWPEADYDRGRESLYSTLSSLRRTIGQVPGGASYLISEMGQIWLDDALVTCDVDGFEGLARSVVGGRLRDDEVVASCLKLEATFRGGACVPSGDPHGRLRARCDELARRYVDVLLIGAEAALRLRDVRQAVWFAESASASASAREDVVACLARALGAAEEAVHPVSRDLPRDL